MRFIALGFFVNSSQRARFDDAYLRSTSGSGPLDIEIELGSATGFIAEYRHMPQYSWGLQAGVSYELDQDIRKITASGAGGSITMAVADGKYRSTTIYGNAVYRWAWFYIPFGLNFSLPVFKPSTTSVNGGLGAQAGIGFQFNELFGLEILSHVTYVNIMTTNGTTTLDYGNGYVSSPRLQGKFSF